MFKDINHVDPRMSSSQHGTGIGIWLILGMAVLWGIGIFAGINLLA